jgi:hypothetical protein
MEREFHFTFLGGFAFFAEFLCVLLRLGLSGGASEKLLSAKFAKKIRKGREERQGVSRPPSGRNLSAAV